VTGVDYIELDELKAMLHISDYVDDELLGGHIAAASRTIDDICHRTFSLDDTATARIYYPDSALVVRTDDIGSASGLAVRIDNDLTGTFELAVTDYTTQPDNALARGVPITKLIAYETYWPTDIRPTVQVTARWGYPTVPEPVRSATGILAGRLYKRADSLLGVAGFGDLGAIMLRAVDPDVQRMLAPYIRVPVG
jgi:hypothetical protein